MRTCQCVIACYALDLVAHEQSFYLVHLNYFLHVMENIASMLKVLLGFPYIVKNQLRHSLFAVHYYVLQSL